MTTYPSVFLKAGRESSVLRGHPWVFSGALERVEKGIVEGAIVRVSASAGETLGFGHFSTGNIAIKMLSLEKEFSSADFWQRRIEAAVALRQTLGLMGSAHTSGFRLIHGEGDGLPGLTADLYTETLVMQFHSTGMLAAEQELLGCLQEVLGERVRCIYAQDKIEDSNGKSPDRAGRYLMGTPENFQFVESSLRYQLDWERGQKTGFFLDQRENRALLRRYAHEAKVLNCFSYSGGFTLSALAGGAREVVSVDSSKPALELLEKNLKLNSFQGAHRTIEADCLQYLHAIEPDFDIIVLDPPAFIKHRGALRGGIKGYETINYQALRQLKAGGILFAFSCSQLLSREEFIETIARSALRAGRAVRVLHQLRQAPCHPVNLHHPEGDYLKGLVLEVS